MKILVTGKNGQLGLSIKNIVDNSLNFCDCEFIFVDKVELNFENVKNIRSYFKVNKFDIIINCAAYTDVDKAELDIKQANLVNHIAVRELAKIAQFNNMKLIHISTDFVFDGNKKKPYTENENTSPINIYGETKLAGEQAIMETMKFNATIIRTSWLYSEFGSNFVKTILNLAKTNATLNIVSDQIGSPTYAYDLALSILGIVFNKSYLEASKSTEIFNYSNEGESSRYIFAKEILSISGIDCKLYPINSRDYPLTAKRPKYSTLCTKKILKKYHLSAEHWKDSLKICLKNI